MGSLQLKKGKDQKVTGEREQRSTPIRERRRERIGDAYRVIRIVPGEKLEY